MHKFEGLEPRRLMSTYFFSSSSSSVGPVSNGSFEHPFNSLAQMPEPISGDAFYFKAGEEFAGSLKKFAGVNDITISSYGKTRTAKRSEEHTSELQSLTNLVCRL